MPNNFISKISPTVKILITLILISMLLMAKSIYLILFITILSLVIFILTEKKVNLYVKVFKKILFILLIILFAYIIIFEQYSFFSITMAIYKYLIATILVIELIFNFEFKSLHEGVYGLLLPLKKIKINIEKLSLDISLSFMFIKYLVSAKERIDEMQTVESQLKIRLKRSLKLKFLGFLNAINCLEIFEEGLKIKFYTLNYKKNNWSSKILLAFFIILFIVCFFKEVIL